MGVIEPTRAIHYKGISMVALSKTVVTPANPPSDWGVECRALTIRDFAFSIKVALASLLGLPVMLLSNTTDLPANQPNLFAGGMVFTILVGVIALGSAWMKTGEPVYEAVKESVRRSKTWQTDVLVPFLEEKYGVKFSPDTEFFGLGYAYATHQGRTFPVKLSGVKSSYNYKYGEDNFFRSFKIIPDQIALEEIIHPKQITFRTISPLA